MFNIFIANDAGTFNELNIAGMDMLFGADDSLFVGDKTSGGIFTAGTSNLFPVGTGSWANLPPPSNTKNSVAGFGANNGATAITSINQTPLVGTLTLGMSGTPGAPGALPPQPPIPPATLGDHVLSLISRLRLI